MEQIHPSSLSSVARSRIAFLRLQSAAIKSESWRGEASAGWLALCYRLTPRVERLSATAVLLDLGVCTDAEASMVVGDLLRRLDGIGIPARVGIAPTAALAQLTLLAAPSCQRVASVTPGDASVLVRRMPVTLLSHLLPCGAITPEIVARLRRYGLHTLGHVATLAEGTLCQQFGRAGAELAALANGCDPHPFYPTPPPAQLRFSIRFPTATPASRVLAFVPAWTQQIAATLESANLAVRELCLVIGWERCPRVAVRMVLRQHTYDPATLLDAVRKLLVPLLLQHAATSSQAPDAVAFLDTMRLTLLDLAPAIPRQGAFWQQRAQRQAALVPVADALARRHGRALVLCARRVASEAIFPEERYCLRTVECISDETLSARLRASASVATSSPVVPPVTVRAPLHSPGWEDIPHRLHWW